MKSYPVVTFVCILSYIRVMTLRVPPGLLTSAGGVRQNRTITGNNNIVTIHERVYSFLNYSILKSDSQKYQRTTPLVLLNIIMGLRGFFSSKLFDHAQVRGQIANETYTLRCNIISG